MSKKAVEDNPLHLWAETSAARGGGWSGGSGAGAPHGPACGRESARSAPGSLSDNLISSPISSRNPPVRHIEPWAVLPTPCPGSLIIQFLDEGTCPQRRRSS